MANFANSGLRATFMKLRSELGTPHKVHEVLIRDELLEIPADHGVDQVLIGQGAPQVGVLCEVHEVLVEHDPTEVLVRDEFVERVALEEVLILGILEHHVGDVDLRLLVTLRRADGALHALVGGGATDGKVADEQHSQSENDEQCILGFHGTILPGTDLSPKARRTQLQLQSTRQKVGAGLLIISGGVNPRRNGSRACPPSDDLPT
jgi:hypothetical protein